MSDRKYWIGFDLGGTKMLAAVYDHEFNLVGREKKKTKANEGMEAGLERFADTIDEAIRKADVDIADVGGIGAGCAGPIDLENGAISEAPNLGWDEVPVRDFLSERYSVPVTVINDVDAGVYGEYRFGAGKQARCVLGVFPGTGIGGGCVYEGRIFRGSRFSCMEFGHIYISSDGPICGAGRQGTLEVSAGRLAIAASAAQAVFRGDAPHLQDAGTDLRSIRSGALAKAIAAGDEVIENIVREAAHRIGVGLTGAVHMLAPDVIVLGGGLVEAMPELFVEEVGRTIGNLALKTYQGTYRVAAAGLGDDANVLGAAAWAAAEFGEAN